MAEVVTAQSRAMSVPGTTKGECSLVSRMVVFSFWSQLKVRQMVEESPLWGLFLSLGEARAATGIVTVVIVFREAGGA